MCFDFLDSYTDIEARNQVARLRDLLHESPRFAAEQPGSLLELSKAPVWEGLKTDSADAQRDVVQLSSYFVGTGESVKCYKAFNFSGFNPVPAVRRLQGDFFYLDFTPLEAELQPVTICANVRGFYVTQSKQGKFNPSPVAATGSNNKKSDAAANPSCLASTLPGCLSLYSAKFKKAFDDALLVHQKTVAQDYGLVVYPPNGWLSRPSSKVHEYDLGRAEYDLMKFTETAVVASTQGRDWNEEMQQARELPHGTIAERIDRDRAMYRVHAEYIEAAKEAAMSIFHGQIQPLNISDAPSSWIYIHNNIFFTQATDMRGIYSDCGGDETFEKMISNDLVALKRINDIENSLRKGNETDSEKPESEAKTESEEEKSGSGICTVDNVLIRYCGKTLFAQTIVPGLFSGLISGESSVSYGSLEGSGVAADSEIHKKLAKIAPSLHLKEHSVAVKPLEGDKDAAAASEPATLWTSADVKGIVGSDGRTYLLDLGHVYPRDGNYAESKYPAHVFRPELLSAYVTRLYYAMRMKHIAERRSELLEKKAAAEAKGETFEYPENLDIPQVEIPTLKVNSDLYVRGVELKDPEESINEDKALNVRLSRFLTDECIPLLLNDWVSGALSLPTDSYTLTTALHSRGINLRYLGRLATATAAMAPSVRDVLFREMIVRAAYTVFRRLAAKVPAYSLAEFVISFLNSFFDTLSTAGKGSRSGVKPPHLTDAQAAATLNAKDDAFGLSHHSLWTTIRQLVEAKYSFTLPEFIPGSIFEVATLRAICLRFGVKLEAKNYDFNKDTPFQVADLIEMQPVLKHVIPTSRDGMGILAAGRTLLEEGRDDTCIEVFQEALNVFQQSFGPLHRDIASTFSSLAIAHYRNGDAEQAMQSLERAVWIFEKTLGADHQETINAYVNLGTVAAASLKFDVARVYARRALYLSCLTAGSAHPETASAYINVAGLLQDSQLYTESLPILTKAQRIIEGVLALTNKEVKEVNADLEMALNGASNSSLATIAHLQAVAHAAQNHFRDALAAEKRNYELLKSLKVDADDLRLAESNQWLSELTRRAVEYEKTNGSGSSAKNAADSRLGKKGVNTKVLKSALASANAIQQNGSPSAKKGSASSIKRTGAARTPGSVIGKATSSTPAKAAGKGKKTAGNTPVPDLL